jgi:hypothetical protein
MPTKRPSEPIAPTTIPGQPLDPKIPPDERGNEMLSAKLQRMPAESSRDRPRADSAQFGAVPGAKLEIPDRSEEPAVLESIDREKSTTAANSSDAATESPPETRDDEGNAVEAEAKPEEAVSSAKPNSVAGSQ